MKFEYPKINKVIEYDSDYVWDNKYKVKIDVGVNGYTNEGIWALIHPSDYNSYVNNSIYDNNKYNRVALLLNSSIYGVVWGSAIPYNLNGSGRPTSIFTDYSDKPSELHDVLTGMNIIKDEK